MSSIPKPFTLNINVNDIFNYHGVNYLVTAVAAGVDDGNGEISYMVTINNATNSVIKFAAKNTVLSSQQGSTTGVQTWVKGDNP